MHGTHAKSTHFTASNNVWSADMSADDRTHNLEAEGWSVKGCLLLNWTAGLGNGLANTVWAAPLPPHVICIPYYTVEKINCRVEIYKTKMILTLSPQTWNRFFNKNT